MIILSSSHTSPFPADVMMLEADILMGSLESDPNHQIIPIMAHPPKKTSDISVQSFLQQVHDFNEKNPSHVKGIKLDFKEIEAVQPSIATLKAIDERWSNEVWLNADIVQGPFEDKKEPVDPTLFLDACRLYPNATLSIGWTTTWGKDYTIGSYTEEQSAGMKRVISENKVPEAGSPITFPVRAGIAAQSKDVLMDLMSTFNETNSPVTLTIWSGNEDAVDVDKLRDLIFSVGLDKVYVDVPQELADQLKLNEGPGGGAWLLEISQKLIQSLLIMWAILTMQS